MHDSDEEKLRASHIFKSYKKLFGKFINFRTLIENSTKEGEEESVDRRILEQLMSKKDFQDFLEKNREGVKEEEKKQED